MPLCTYFDDHVVQHWDEYIDTELLELLLEIRDKGKTKIYVEKKAWRHTKGFWFWKKVWFTYSYSVYTWIQLHEYQVINLAVEKQTDGIQTSFSRSDIHNFLLGWVNGMDVFFHPKLKRKKS